MVTTNLSLLLEYAGDGNVNSELLSITDCNCPPPKDWSLKKDAKWVIFSEITVNRITSDVIEDMYTLVTDDDNDDDDDNGLVVVVDVLGSKQAIDRAYIPIPTTTIDNSNQNDWCINGQKRRNFVLKRIDKLMTLVTETTLS